MVVNGESEGRLKRKLEWWPERKTGGFVNGESGCCLRRK